MASKLNTCKTTVPDCSQESDSKTIEILDTTGIRKRLGDFSESEMQKKFNLDELNLKIVTETIARTAGRNSILVFCCGVDHSKAMTATFAALGESAVTPAPMTSA